MSIPIASDSLKHIGWDNLNIAKFKDFYLFYFASDEFYDWHHMVWHKYHSLRYSAYAWLALGGGLKTSDVLIARNIPVLDRYCSFCHTSLETTTHLMFECDYSFKVLVKLIPSFQTHFFRPTIYLALQHIDNFARTKSKNFKNSLLLILNALVYFLWMERNNRRMFWAVDDDDSPDISFWMVYGQPKEKLILDL
ncbi:hypothetical protein M5K25_019282 [Dendrobium thyrsiflorum]|uniref:Reverse transcriptase zinc-binding domain-containing protein n=1 Tax=Dendrobium thyrsiflorum TaxID=117978 RepID=A0ABD0UF94_DENTH